MKNMKDFLTTIANGIINDEAIEFAKAELEKRANENASAAKKRSDKWLADNGELLRELTEVLKNASHPLTCAEIIAAVDGINSTSKATAVASRVEGVKVSEVQVDKRVVKAYSL
jgi:hypothetical protein